MGRCVTYIDQNYEDTTYSVAFNICGHVRFLVFYFFNVRIMKAKEKAEELFDKFSFIETCDGSGIYDDELTINDIKKATLILIDELIEFENRIIKQLDKITRDAGGQFKVEAEFWLQVKQEIEKL